MPLLPPGFLEAQVAALAGGPGARAPQLVAAADPAAACGVATGLSRWLCEHRVHMLWALAAEGAMLVCVLAAYVALSRARHAEAELVRGPQAAMLLPVGLCPHLPTCCGSCAPRHGRALLLLLLCVAGLHDGMLRLAGEGSACGTPGSLMACMSSIR